MASAKPRLRRGQPRRALQYRRDAEDFGPTPQCWVRARSRASSGGTAEAHATPLRLRQRQAPPRVVAPRAPGIELHVTLPMLTRFRAGVELVAHKRQIV